MAQKGWTLVWLNQQMNLDLQQCHTELERHTCKVICIKEMRDFWHNMNRKPTPGEVAIAEMHGIIPTNSTV